MRMQMGLWLIGGLLYLQVQAQTIHVPEKVYQRFENNQLEYVVTAPLSNLTNQTLRLKWKVLRTRLPYGWDYTVEHQQGSGMLTLAAHEQQDFRLILYPLPEDTGTAEVEVLVYDPQDSAGTARIIRMQGQVLPTMPTSASEVGQLTDEVRLVVHPGLISFINTGATAYTVTIYDLLGNQVWKDRLDGKARLNLLHQFTPGIYWVRLQSEAGQIRTFSIRLQ